MATWVDAAAFPTSMLRNSRATMISVPLWIQILNPRIQGSHITFDGGILTELQELLLAHHPILRQIHRLEPGSFFELLLRWPVKQRLRPLLVCYFRCKRFQERFSPKKRRFKKKNIVDLKHHMKSVSSKDVFFILWNTTSMMSISVWRFQMKFHYSGGCWVFEGFPLHSNCMSPSSSRAYSSRKTLQTMTIIAIPIAF